MTDQADTVRNAYEAPRTLPVRCAPPSGASRDWRTTADTGFAAQMLGAGGQVRGLKGGTPVLQAARRAYLETEWSGRGDRRTVAGALALTRI